MGGRKSGSIRKVVGKGTNLKQAINSLKSSFEKEETQKIVETVVKIAVSGKENNENFLKFLQASLLEIKPTLGQSLTRTELEEIESTTPKRKIKRSELTAEEKALLEKRFREVGDQ